MKSNRFYKIILLICIGLLLVYSVCILKYANIEVSFRNNTYQEFMKIGKLTIKMIPGWIKFFISTVVLGACTFYSAPFYRILLYFKDFRNKKALKALIVTARYNYKNDLSTIFIKQTIEMLTAFVFVIVACSTMYLFRIFGDMALLIKRVLKYDIIYICKAMLLCELLFGIILFIIKILNKRKKKNYSLLNFLIYFDIYILIFNIAFINVRNTRIVLLLMAYDTTYLLFLCVFLLYKKGYYRFHSSKLAIISIIIRYEYAFAYIIQLFFYLKVPKDDWFITIWLALCYFEFLVILREQKKMVRSYIKTQNNVLEVYGHIIQYGENNVKCKLENGIEMLINIDNICYIYYKNQIDVSESVLKFLGVRNKIGRITVNNVEYKFNDYFYISDKWICIQQYIEKTKNVIIFEVNKIDKFFVINKKELEMLYETSNKK